MLIAVVSGAAQAQESDDFTLPPEYVAQIPLSDAGSRIQDITRSNDLSGFGGIRLDDENQAVMLHWKGEVPSQVADFIVSTDVTITVVNVPYSRDELLEEIGRLKQDRWHGSVVLNSIGINRTFDGIRIGINTDDNRPEAEKVAAAKEVFTSDIPLTFEVKDPLMPFRDRWDDQDPFWGGAAMDTQTQLIPPVYAYCSSGFAVTLSDSSEGMLTAAHCEFENALEWQTPDGDLVIGYHGSTTSCSSGGGVLEPTDEQEYEGRVYRGSWQSGSSANVISADAAMVDELVFVSGGLSGQHMVRVVYIDDYQYVGTFCGGEVGPGFHTVDEQGDGSVGQGDSGGPVYKYVGAYDVRPLGIIQGGDHVNHSAPCEGYQGGGWTPSRTCAYHSFHANIINILNVLDLELQ